MIDSKSILEEANRQDMITKNAFEIVENVNHEIINEALSASPDILDATSFDILLMIIDDSGSINQINDPLTGDVIGPKSICDGQNLVIKAFLNSKKADHEGVTVLTWPLNSELPVQPLTALLDPDLTLLDNGTNYSADGGTPLYDKAVLGLATVLTFKMYVEKVKSGICRGSILIVSDGYDQHSKSFDANDVHTLIKELSGKIESPDIIVAFMGINGDESLKKDFGDVAKQMGVHKVFVTTSEPKVIRNAFFKFSQVGINDGSVNKH